MTNDEAIQAKWNDYLQARVFNNYKVQEKQELVNYKRGKNPASH